MYERFYDLRERPFALSPDPDYLYPSRVHREALDYLRYGLESHAGFVAITGEIGSGKTTLLNTMLEPRELLETIMIDFGLDPGGRSKPLLLRDLAQYLVDQRLAGRLVLLVIDEAQNLSLGALEELRMLSNLETEKSKLLQIIMVGQPNLRDKLSSPELEQLRQRITVSYHLAPLDADETSNYINHRLRRASIGAPLEFGRDVTDLIHARSRGVPRVTNVICDAALVFGYAEERRQIDIGLMQDVVAELEMTGVLPVRATEPTTTIVTQVPAAAESGEPARAWAPPPPVLPPQAAPVPPAASRPDPFRPAVSREDAEGLEERVAQIDQREQALRQRERELADQRRVLAEEYRLLRMQRPAAPPPAMRVHIPSAPGPVTARFEPARQESIWARFKRIILGTSPVIGEN
jgi:general secretion pathway protein A